MKKDWKYKKLGEVTTTINGLWTGKKPPFVNVAVVRNTNFTKDCKLDMTNVAYLDVEEKQFSTRKLQYGDIIIEKSGGSEKQPVGRPVLFNINEGDYSFSNFTSTLRINNKEELDPHFLHYSLVGAYFRGVTGKMQAKTTGIHNLDFKAYLKLLIPTPSLPEQQQIVAELDLLSGMIEKQKAQIEELDKLSQSIFYDMFGDPVTNEKGWEVKNLKDIAVKIGSGATPRGGNQSYKDEGISLIRSMNVHNNDFVYDDLAFIDDEQATQLNNVIVESNDVLLNITGASVARCCIVPDDVLPARVNQHVCIIRPNTVLANSIYLNRFFTSIEEQSVLLLLSRSNAATREALPKNLLENCRIVLPPLSLQQEFAAKIEAIEAMKAKVRQSLIESETLFNSRMDYYFN